MYDHTPVVRSQPNSQSLAQLASMGIPLQYVPASHLREVGDVANVHKLLDAGTQLGAAWVATCPEGSGMSVVIEASVGGFIFKRAASMAMVIRKW